MVKKPEVIGVSELVDLVDLGLLKIPAKIDTGADISTIWVSKVTETKNGLECIFFGPDSPFFTGKAINLGKTYDITRIQNSFAVTELRYKIKLQIKVKERLIYATFTLSDRSQKTYPILLGKRLLRGKFIVDVAHEGPKAAKHLPKKKFPHMPGKPRSTYGEHKL